MHWVREILETKNTNVSLPGGSVREGVSGFYVLWQESLYLNGRGLKLGHKWKAQKGATESSRVYLTWAQTNIGKSSHATLFVT
jgi:hypothetical protein